MGKHKKVKKWIAGIEYRYSHCPDKCSDYVVVMEVELIETAKEYRFEGPEKGQGADRNWRQASSLLGYRSRIRKDNSMLFDTRDAALADLVATQKRLLENAAARLEREKMLYDLCLKALEEPCQKI